MKIRNGLWFLFLTLAFLGCSKEDEEISKKLQLTYPVTSDTVRVCCFNFKWEPGTGSSYEFTLSEDENFTNPIIDTLITTPTFPLSDTLAFSTRYYWRVKDGSTQQVSSFITKQDSIVPFLTLLSPANTSLNPCCANFLWDSNLSGSYHFKLSEQSNFSSLVVDSVVSPKNFASTRMLRPNKTYYWQVQAGNLTQSSSFTIKDIPAQFQGSYPNAIIHKYDWSGVNGVTNDTTFTGTISLIKEGDKLRFIYAPDNVNRLLVLNTWEAPQNSNTISYWDLVGPNSSCRVYLNFTDGSIQIDNGWGGLGGGTRWQISVTP